MAFKDMQVILQDGAVKVNYLDKPHMYYRRYRRNWDLPIDNPKAWGKAKRPKGVTTLLGDTLEKKGLMTWPMNMALRELFGFYDFKDEEGNQKTGFSKNKGTMWADGKLLDIDQETALPLVLSASKGYLRRQKKGADIGSIVHDAIEHYVKGVEFDILKTYTESVHEAEYETDADKERALEQIEEDVAQANLAFGQFQQWWKLKKPKLLGAEDLIYSQGTIHKPDDPSCTSIAEDGNCHCEEYCGTFDGLIELDGKVVLCDWKTSNAYDNGAPQGVGYDYFIQSAAYAAAWEEMGNGRVDDLLIVSARKDGGFDTKLASEVGLSVEDALDWWKAVKTCYRLMARTKNNLMNRGE